MAINTPGNNPNQNTGVAGSAVRTADSPTNLAACPDGAFPDGSLAYVTSPASLWVLDKNSTLTVDSQTVVATRTGIGRWVQMSRRYSGTIPVTVFGADSTGFADSTTAFTNAINALSGTGITLSVPSGTYKVTAALPSTLAPTVVIEDSVTFIGSSGTAALTTLAKLTGRAELPVTLFGADPTGSVDSLAAVNAALAAGVRPYFPSGTYQLSAAPTVPTTLTLPIADIGATFTGPGAAAMVALVQRQASGTSGGSGDAQSIILGDISQVEWTYGYAGNLNRVLCSQNQASDGTYLDAALLNRGAAAVGDGARAMIFALPLTATGGTLYVPAALPSGVLSSTIYVSVEERNGTVHASRTCALAAASGALPVFSLAVTGLTAGEEYVIRIVCNNTGLGTTSQAQALIGRVSFVPNSTSGVFAKPFTRIAVQPPAMHDCGRSDFIGGKFWRYNEFSRFVFDTTATSLAVEWETDVYGLDTDAPYMLVVVNGRPFATLFSAPPTGDLSADYLATQELTLPNGRKRVEIVCGSQQAPQPVDTVYNPCGTFPRAVYVAGSGVDVAEIVAPSPTGRRLLVVCDSLCSGISNPQSVLFAWPVRLRQRAGFPGGVCVDGFGGRTLDEITKTTGAINAFVRVVQKYAPTDMWIALGANDAGQSKLTSATYQTRLTSLLNALHTAMPHLQIWVQTLVPGWGDNTWRAAAVNAATSFNSPQILAVEGQLAYLASQVTGSTHPNQDGCSSYTDYVASVFQGYMPHHCPGCVAFYEADYATVVGGKATAVTDQSIAANNGSAGMQGAYVVGSTSWNGHNAISTPFRISSGTNSGLSGDQIFTLIAGVALPDLTSSGVVAGWGNSSVAADGFGLAFSVPTAGDWNMAWAGSDNNVFGAYTTGAQIVTVRKKAAGAINANIDLRENGATQTLGATFSTATPNTTNTPITWGAWDTGGTLPIPAGGTCSFVAVFSRPLADVEVQALEHSLSDKYGIIGL